MTAAARAWIGCVLACGAAALGLALVELGANSQTLYAPAFWVLLVSACLAHAFPVIAPRHQAYHATHAFLMAAVLLLSWPGVAVIVVVAHLTEWLRRPRPLVIQLYNVAVYLLGTGAAVLALFALNVRPFAIADARGLAVAFGAAALLLMVNHGLTAMVLWVARGVAPRSSGLFGRDSLTIDGILLVLGIGMAASWLAQPLAIVASSAPLVLIYRGLRLANAESANHRDELTGLYNARHFLEALELELRRAESTAQPTGVMVAIVDDVPELVQRFGHATLDFLVAGLADRLTRALRGFDVVARLDEGRLGVLLPSSDASSVEQMARRVDAAVTSQPFALATTREPVSACVSIAWLSTATCTRASDLLASVQEAAVRAEMSGPRAILAAAPPEAILVPEASIETVQPVMPPPAALTARWLLPRAWFVAFQASVVALGVCTTLLALLAPLPDVSLAAGIFALVALAELLAFQLYDQSSFSVSFTPILAAGLLGGPAAAVVATWSVALLRGVLRRSPWYRVAFNGSAFTLLGVLATLAATGAGNLEVRATQLGVLSITTAVASSIYYLHTFLIAGAIALDAGADPRHVWDRNYRWLYPHYILLGWMGLGLAVATIDLGPLGTAMFLAPPLAMRFVLKQYVDRTAGAVHRLEAANAELRSASALLRERTEDLLLLSDLGQLVVAEPPSDTLPVLVAQRCVPALGDVCAVIWRSARGIERHVHTSLPDWLERGSGTWCVAPLAGVDYRLGWLLTWTSRRLEAEEVARRTALLREVAQRVALVLQRDTLLEEAAELDALRMVDRAKSDFIATTAHELRTPLTSLQGYTELLRDSVEPVLRERWLGIVHLEAAQLGQVVDQLLDVSRLDSGRFQADRRHFSLTELACRTAEHFRPQAGLSGHVLEIQADDLPDVYADQAQVERVLRNLVSNALKYSPGGGQICVSVVERPGGEVEVCVEDQGLGIPADWLGRLFERFQRVDRPERAAIRGIGLGLYIARQLVELNGGRIWATSEGVHQGATFHFTLPVAVSLER